MKTLLLALTLLFSSVALADTQVSLMGSLNFNTPDTTDVDNADDGTSAGGWGAGIRALMGMSDQLYFRSGVGFVQKNFSYKVDGNGKSGKRDMQYSYLNIPLTFYWKASPRVGFFLGTALYAKLDQSCDGTGDYKDCSGSRSRTIVYPGIIGFDFNLTRKIGMEVSYEAALSETSKNIKVNTTVLSFLYHFDDLQ